VNEARLPTHLWVGAKLRLCAASGVHVYVLRRGEAEGGLVLLKVTIPFQGARVFSMSRDLKGVLGWVPGLSGDQVDEPTADAWIERQVSRDPDLWVVEVESRDGSHLFGDLS
jgi:hypothetical protein